MSERRIAPEVKAELLRHEPTADIYGDVHCTCGKWAGRGSFTRHAIQAALQTPRAGQET